MPDYYFLANPQMVDRVFMGMCARASVRSSSERSSCVIVWSTVGRETYFEVH